MPTDRNDTESPRARTLRAGGYRCELLPKAPYEASFTAGQDVLGFAFESQSGHHAFASNRLLPFRTKPNSLAFTPRGCEVFSVSSEGGEYLRIVREDDGADRIQSPAQFNDRINPIAIQCAESIRNAMLCSVAVPLIVEENAVVLFECAGMDSALTDHKAAMAGCMTPARLKRIDELIDANMGQRISIGDMAGALGLSEGFFIRAFKAAVGKSPHGYLLDRQLAHARFLLQRAHHDLRDVALMTGFSSHAHMSAVFKRRLGIRPSEYCG